MISLFVRTQAAGVLPLKPSGRYTPTGVLRTAQAIKQLAPGQVLLVLSTDPGFGPDMRHWAARTGHALLDVDRQGDEFHVFLRRG
jgi:tRNA 2-thiouridine synthesizing protein A